MNGAIRIWYQSYVDYANGKTYWDRLRTHLDAIVDPGTTVDITLGRIGAAALPLGLMAVGAGLEFGGLQKAPGLAAGLLAIRHAVLPAVALGLGLLLALPAGQAQMLLAFAALPTASSCYVLAARMGGDGPYVAGLVTASTLLGMLSLPLAMIAFAAVHGAGG